MRASLSLGVETPRRFHISSAYEYGKTPREASEKHLVEVIISFGMTCLVKSLQQTLAGQGLCHVDRSGSLQVVSNVAKWRYNFETKIRS